MKQKILEALKTRYAKMGFGQKAFDGVADYLSKTVTKEEDVETAIAGVEGLLKAFQSDADKTRTEKSAAERRLADLEAKVKALGGVPEENEDEPGKKGQAGGGEDLAKAVAAAVAEAVKPLRDEIANFKQGRVTETRKQRLGTVIGRLPEHLRKGYSRIGVDGLTDDEFDKLVTETEAEVDEIVSKENARGAVLGRPLGAGGNGGSHSGAEKEATDEEAKAVADRLGI